MSIKQELQKFCKIHNILINAVSYEGTPALQIMKIEDNASKNAFYLGYVDSKDIVDWQETKPQANKLE